MTPPLLSDHPPYIGTAPYSWSRKTMPDCSNQGTESYEGLQRSSLSLPAKSYASNYRASDKLAHAMFPGTRNFYHRVGHYITGSSRPPSARGGYVLRNQARFMRRLPLVGFVGYWCDSWKVSELRITVVTLRRVHTTSGLCPKLHHRQKRIVSCVQEALRVMKRACKDRHPLRFSTCVGTVECFAAHLHRSQ